MRQLWENEIITLHFQASHLKTEGANCFVGTTMSAYQNQWKIQNSSSALKLFWNPDVEIESSNMRARKSNWNIIETEFEG